MPRVASRHFLFCCLPIWKENFSSLTNSGYYPAHEGEAMKKWLIRIVLILVILIVAVVVAGALLPEEHHASRTLLTKQSPQALWDAINDHAAEPQWRTDVASVQS